MGGIDTGNLDIIITHYREPWELGKQMFDMLAQQRLVDLNRVGVILVNDGEENRLPDECFKGYPYRITQMSIPKGGVSRARNAGMDASTADWIMFCDFDDCFMNLYGLYLLFEEIDKDKYDTIWSYFVEETKDDNDKTVLVAHERDMTFIHGKAHRRQYLIDKGIRYNEKLTIHEDCYFNTFAQECTEPERVGAIKTQWYIWKWNENSVVRKYRSRRKEFVLDTYDHLMRQRIAVTEEFFRREMTEKAMITIVKTVMDSFYDFQQEKWKKLENRAAVMRAERWVAAYLKRYAEYYMRMDAKTISTVAKTSRELALLKGDFFVETMTVGQWLKHIVKDVRPIPESEQNV